MAYDPGGTAARSSIYTVLASALTALAIVVLCVVGYLVIVSGAELSLLGGPAGQPTQFALPSATPTLEGPTPAGGQQQAAATEPSQPAAEPLPSGTVFTPSPSRTPRATVTPLPTSEPADTPLPTPSETPVPTEEAATEEAAAEEGATYVPRGEIRYRDNFANDAGCDWAGIAGQVFDASGSPQDGVTVHLTGSGLDERTTSGSAPEAYGAGGYEFVLSGAPIAGAYRVQVEDGDGSPLSDEVEVRTEVSCESNLALLDFEAVR